jgi:predicted TIM-barrel fold metal-dependent hydrolase
VKKTTLRDAFFARGRTAGCPIYDLHGHMGPWYGIYMPGADADSMVRAMDRAGVRMLVFCHHAALFNPELGNRPGIEAVRRYPDRLRAYCGINPNYPEIVRRDLDSYDRYPDVYVGFKFLSDYHGYAITHERYREVLEFADRRRLLVLMHTWGGSGCNGPAQVRQVAEKYRNVAFVLGHSCHGEWDAVIELARAFPNLYLDLCAILDERGIVEKFVDAVGSERVLFGTDLPWFNEHFYIGALLGADITDADRHNIFHRNAEKLLAPFIGR